MRKQLCFSSSSAFQQSAGSPFPLSPLDMSRADPMVLHSLSICSWVLKQLGFSSIRRYYPVKNVKVSSMSKCFPCLSSELIFGLRTYQRGIKICGLFFHFPFFVTSLPPACLASMPGAIPDTLPDAS